MTRDRHEHPFFWRSVGARLFVVVVLGWLSILWFRGCLAPQIQDEILQDQQKTSGPELPPR